MTITAHHHVTVGVVRVLMNATIADLVPVEMIDSKAEEVTTDSNVAEMTGLNVVKMTGLNVVMMMTPVQNLPADLGDQAEPATRMALHLAVEARRKKRPPEAVLRTTSGRQCLNQDVKNIDAKVS